MIERQAAPDRASFSPRARASGFTLVELLVVISVIALLATIVMFAMAGAQEAARRDRTRGQIARIHALLAQRWESYLTRRVPPVQQPVGNEGRWNVNAARKARTDRVDAIRELMRMELPDRISDVMTDPVVLTRVPRLSQAYRRKVSNLVQRGQKGSWNLDYQGAECLYLILSQMRDGDTRALSFFSEKEIGDVDEDGVPEILDAWGTPIAFLRWAPGFRPAGSYQDGDSPDPFDPRGDYPNAFALFPLVYSPGPDKEYEVFLGAFTYGKLLPPNNPYALHETTDGDETKYVGARNDDNQNGRDDSIDNIHNHMLITGS